jgi:hypothetical protein
MTSTFDFGAMPHAALQAVPHLGDHVGLAGTNVAGDVTRIDQREQDRVSFKVTTVRGKANASKTAKAFRGAWVTCSSTLLVPDPASPDESHGLTGRPEVDSALRAHVDRLTSEFGARYSREQIERRVQVMAARYSDVRVATFVPIFVYRDARSALSGRDEPLN